MSYIVKETFVRVKDSETRVYIYGQCGFTDTGKISAVIPFTTKKEAQATAARLLRDYKTGSDWEKTVTIVMMEDKKK